MPVTHTLTEADLVYRMGCVEIKAIVCTPQGDVHSRMMAEYKWIRLIEFIDQIPKTISNKICKAALRR